MTQQEIDEGIKIISDFNEEEITNIQGRLSFPYKLDKKSLLCSNILIKEKVINEVKFKLKVFDPEDFFIEVHSYHSSWDLIMPVVHKCLNQFVEMDEHDKLFQNINNALMRVNIEETFCAVTDFIKAYNTNKIKD